MMVRACVMVATLGAAGLAAAQDSLAERIQERLSASSIERRMEERAAQTESIRDRIKRHGFVAVDTLPERRLSKVEFEDVELVFTPIERTREREPAPKRVPPLPAPKPKPEPQSTPKPAFKVKAPSSDAGVLPMVERYCAQYGLDESLVLAVIRAESAFNPSAVSPAGACGLMQLMPGTAADMGVDDVFDTAQNVAGGTQYLALMLSMFDGDVDMALAGYNAGPQNVKKYGGVPPFNETRQYVKRVRMLQAEYAGDRPASIALAQRNEAEDLPAADVPYFALELENGLTQRADIIMESETHYLVQFKGHASRVPKQSVKSIMGPGV